MLLGDFVPVGKVDLGVARFHHRQLGTNQRHRRLQRETGSHTFGVTRVTGLELWHFGVHPHFSRLALITLTLT
jgi:hypothetical protein